MGVYGLSSVALLDRKPSLDRLQAALETVQESYEVLRCTIHQQPDKLHSFTPSNIQARVHEIHSKSLPDILADEVSVSWPDPTVPDSEQLCYKLWLASDFGGRDSDFGAKTRYYDYERYPAALGISYSHALLDGLSAARVLGNIMNVYNQMSENSSLRLDFVELSPPLEVLQEVEWKNGPDIRKWSTFATLLSKGISSQGFILPASTELARKEIRKSKIFLHALDKNLVQNLRKAARLKGTSINGALFAAMCVAIAKQWGGESQSRVVIQQAVDLLRRLTDKKVQDTQIGCFVDGFSSVKNIDVAQAAESDAFWSLARNSQEELRKCLENRDYQANMRELKLLLELTEYVSLDTVVGLSLDANTKGRSASGLLSNMGVIDLNGDYRGNEGNDDRISNDDDDSAVRIRRYHLSEAQAKIGFGIMLHAATVADEGSLCLTFSYADPILNEQQVAEFVDVFKSVLVSASAQ